MLSFSIVNFKFLNSQTYEIIVNIGQLVRHNKSKTLIHVVLLILSTVKISCAVNKYLKKTLSCLITKMYD